MRVCLVLAEILSVVFNIWINPEQTQILIFGQKPCVHVGFAH